VSAGRPARRAAAGLAVALALAGCARRAPPPDLSLDPAALLAEVRAAQDRVRTVQGTARVTLEGPSGGGGEQFLAAERPGRLRVEVRDFFGNVVGLAAVDGGVLALYDARAQVLYRGAATAGNLARLLPLRAEPGALVDLLCATAPLLDGAPVAAEPGDGRVFLTLRRDDREQVLEVGPGAALLSARTRRPVLGDEAPAEVDVTFRGLHQAGGVPFPDRVEARLAGGAFTLRWRDVDVNGPVDPALFRLEPPRGARVVDLDGLAP